MCAGTPRGSEGKASLGPGVVPKTSAVRRTNRASQLCSMLLFCAVAALLGCVSLLLVGHYMASSPDRLASLNNGTYGAAAASFGRCIPQLRQLSSPGLYNNNAGSASHSLMVEGACMYSAIRRKAALTWATAEPHVSSHISTACTAARRAAAACGVRLRYIMAASRVHTAACHALAAQLAEVVAEKCPACTAVTNAAMNNTVSIALAWGHALASWEAGGGAGKLRPPPFSELYHDAALLRDIPRRLQTAWSAVIPRFAAAAPAWAGKAAVSLQERVCSVTAAWAGLLEQSVAAVLPEQERLAAEQLQSSDPKGAPPETGHMHVAAQWLNGWLGNGHAPNGQQGEEAAVAATGPSTHDSHEEASDAVDSEVAAEDTAANGVVPEQAAALPAIVNVSDDIAREDESVVAQVEDSPEAAEAGISSSSKEIDDAAVIEQEEVLEAAQPNINDDHMAAQLENTAAAHSNLEEAQSSATHDLAEHTADEEAVGNPGVLLEQTDIAQAELPPVQEPSMQEAPKVSHLICIPLLIVTNLLKIY